ncbi:putative fatty acid methyltransferase [Tepidimonas thermarum]|uniref:Putative fatty acid methyltransferase n=1 Tax=Tepidimonas thermarum TaxID=335431 RepID=A0A554X3X4_9BURK|nr:cyclopropane-fatty-acyl-phospholipid synthase family protein [Tepidimonas thermarum]TSE30537.1 putative fatty acid methyltransferase [Tepidimonas thermarum]
MPVLDQAIEGWVRRWRERVDLPLRVRWRAGGAAEAGPQWDLGRFDEPRVVVTIRDAAAVPALLTPSLDSLGQAYVEGHIDVDGAIEDVIAMAQALVARADEAPTQGPLRRWLRTFVHTRRADREAIQYHYDVSNAFYAEWLDPAMVYSCAYFERGDEDLATAQRQKIDHILTKIRLQPGHTLLDIGCGWGALVIRAAQAFGARCVGITLSQAQYDLARERVAAAGLQDRVEIRLQDYRDVDGTFDRITSVGMFEHVGLRHLPDYFRIIRERLAPDGWAMNHGITTTDAHDGETPHGGGRFIDRYVFPHGELPHISTVLRTMQEGGLESFDIENLRRHYARTLMHWSCAFEAKREKLRTLVSERIWRIWRVYLAGCAWAFEHDQIALFQVLCRPAGRSAQELPWSRRWIYEAHSRP